MSEDPEYLDQLMDEGAAFMEERARQAGIDPELVRITGMSLDETAALEWFLLDSRDLSEIEQNHLQSAVRHLLFGLRFLRAKVSNVESEGREKSRIKRNKLHTVILILSLSLFWLALLKFDDFRIAVDPYEGTVTAIKSSWWGFVQTEKEIKWMQTKDYDSPGWMAKDANGEWYIYIREDDSDDF